MEHTMHTPFSFPLQINKHKKLSTNNNIKKGMVWIPHETNTGHIPPCSTTTNIP